VSPNKALVRWLVVGAFAAVALILGYIGLREYVLQQYLRPKAVPEYGRGWADILFYDVQLFVLNAAPAGGPGPIPLPLGIARFLAPATALAATVAAVRLLLSEQLRRWAAARASGHAIVTGDGPVAAELARKLRAEHRTVVLVSTTSAAASGPAMAAGVRDRRLLEVSGDPTDAGTLRAAGLGRADVLYACTELSTTNAATVLRARELWQDQHRPLVAFAQVRDAEICVALRTRRIGTEDNLRFRLDLFDVAHTYALTGQPERGAGIARAGRQEAAGLGIEILVADFLAAEAMAWTAAGVRGGTAAMEAVEMARRIQNPALSAFVFCAAAGAIWPADPQAALTLIEDSLTLTRAGAFDPILGTALTWAGFIRAQNGDLPGSLAALAEAMAQQHADGNRLSLGMTLQIAAVALARLGETEPAFVLSGAFSAHFPSDISAVHENQKMGIGEAQSLARHPLGKAAYSAALARGAAMDDDQLVEYAQGEFRRLAALRAEPGH
jgi:voltage-gated potassium channel Kch